MKKPKAEKLKSEMLKSSGGYQLNKCIMEMIWLERLRQQALLKQGKFSWSCGTVGEVAQLLNDQESKPLKPQFFKESLTDELCQIAACAIAWLESLESNP